MSESKYHALAIPAIPFGLITFKDFIEAPLTYELICAAHEEIKDPLDRMACLLVAYQLSEIKAQLIDAGRWEQAKPAAQKLRDIATRHVTENFSGILHAMGEKDAARLLKVCRRLPKANQV